MSLDDAPVGPTPSNDVSPSATASVIRSDADMTTGRTSPVTAAVPVQVETKSIAAAVRQIMGALRLPAKQAGEVIQVVAKLRTSGESS